MWWHDHYYLDGGWPGLRRRWPMFTVALLTILAGAFICIAGMYAITFSLVKAYASGEIAPPFTCGSA